MSMTKLGALCTAALFALSGTIATASDAKPAAVPFCSKTVTDNCMERSSHATGMHHHARHHEGRHHAKWKHARHHHKAKHEHKAA